MTAYPKLSFTCPMKWDELRGDERARFCEKCQRSVINLTHLTEAQRTALLAAPHSERLCVAYRQRLVAATPRSSPSRRHRWAARAATLGLGAAAVFVAAFAASTHRPSRTAVPRPDPREVVMECYYSAREKVEDWVEDVRVYFGGTPRPRPMMMGMVCPSSWTPPPPAVLPAKSPSTGENPPSH